MCFEGIDHRYVVSSVQVPLVLVVENVEPFVLPCVVIVLVVPTGIDSCCCSLGGVVALMSGCCSFSGCVVAGCWLGSSCGVDS